MGTGRERTNETEGDIVKVIIVFITLAFKVAVKILITVNTMAIWCELTRIIARCAIIIDTCACLTLCMAS
jgi:hypothetical protein